MAITTVITNSSDSNVLAVTTTALNVLVMNLSSAKGGSDLATNGSAAKGVSDLESSTNKSSIKSTERGSNSSANVALAASNALFTTSSVPGQSIEEKPSQLEWQVVAQGIVHVRLARRPWAAVSGLVPEGGIILGTGEGKWIKLFRRKGFIMAEKDGTVRLVQRNVSYSWLPKGSTSCKEFGKFPIKNPSACEAAAVTLGLASTHAGQRKQLPMLEVGCYSDSSSVLWHVSGPSSNNSMPTQRHFLRPLCASRSYLSTNHAKG